MNEQQERVLSILEKMKIMVETNEDYAEMFDTELEYMLDDMLDDDAFGTEGQNDPRGDRRDIN